MTDFVDVNASRLLKKTIEENDAKLIGQVDKGKQPMEIYNLFKQRLDLYIGALQQKQLTDMDRLSLEYKKRVSI